MKITMKHYYYFGRNSQAVGKNLLLPSSWDAIRTDDNQETPFSVPKERDKWVEKCRNHKSMADRAMAITDFLKSQRSKYQRVNSFGVGGGFMEYNLKKNYPEILLNCSDFTPKTVQRLKEVFLEADNIEVFNMMNDRWVNSGSDTLYLLCRLDADFSNEQWDIIFRKIHQRGIENVLFVPCDVSTIRFLIREKLGYFIQLLKGRKMTFAGYLRNKDQLKSLFEKYYNCVQELPIADLTGFLLKIKK